MRIAARPGGVDVEPLDDETRPVVQQLLGRAVRPAAVLRLGRAGPACSRRSSSGCAASGRRFSPIRSRRSSRRSPRSRSRCSPAVAIRNRLVERLGEPVGEAWAFPTRERVADAGEQELVEVGFSRRKAEYAVGLARSDLDLDGLAALDDDEVRARLTALRGLGPWTAEWFLARHLARPHAWPAGDLALRKAAEISTVSL